jgi:histidinol-phosphate aminotransferase
MPSNVDTSGWKLPINLGLNDGTYCSQRAIDVLQQHDTRTALRNYSDGDNSQLREVLAKECGCRPENIFLHNGSGPILKQVLPHVIRSEIKSSAKRVIKHVVSKEGYPIITPVWTYGKVPLKAIAAGLTVRLVPLRWEEDFKLHVDELDAAIAKGDGLVYLANPNNPTGNVLISREDLAPLLKKYPGTTFWLDEAYVQYVSPGDHQYVVDMVVDHPNMFCTRTFSFAYGMAAVRIGYLVAREELVQQLEGQVTNYRIPLLTERMGVAAALDTQHLEDVRSRSAEARELIRGRLEKYDNLRVFPSTANFLLVRTMDGPKAQKVAAGLLERGIKIKTFAPLKEHDFSAFFRITIGTPDENLFLCDMLDEVLSS